MLKTGRVALPIALLLSACSNGSPGSEAPASSSPVATSTGESTAKAAASDPVPSAPAPVASQAAAASTPPPSSASSGPNVPPLSFVDVKNIGIHIGGGPTDTEGMKRTKGPIKRSIEPHMDEFKRCFAAAEDRTKGGDVSVDLKIEKQGGKAELKKFKGSVKGADFERCMRDAFAQIDFEKPADGTTMVSYSLRFTPAKNAQ